MEIIGKHLNNLIENIKDYDYCYLCNNHPSHGHSEDCPLNVEQHKKMPCVDDNLECKHGSKALAALTEIQRLNRLRTDRDAYIFDVAEWGLGFVADKPSLEDFGLNDGEQNE